jgi:hypothetical protein
MPLQNRLNSPLPKAEDLAAAFCEEFIGVQGQSHRLRVLRDHQGHAERALSLEAFFGRK